MMCVYVAITLETAALDTPNKVAIWLQTLQLNGDQYSVLFENLMSPILQYFLIFDIFVHCNWVFIQWQQHSTHLHTNNTQNNTINNFGWKAFWDSSPK